MRSCVINRGAIVTDEAGLAVFELIRRQRTSAGGEGFSVYPLKRLATMLTDLAAKQALLSDSTTDSRAAAVHWL